MGMKHLRSVLAVDVQWATVVLLVRGDGCVNAHFAERPAYSPSLSWLGSMSNGGMEFLHSCNRLNRRHIT
jgi:hypothetical protein